MVTLDWAPICTDVAALSEFESLSFESIFEEVEELM